MLGVLVLVYVFNFVDRQILSILAERIKADLRLSDAEIGFLYGTAFAVFFAVFGIPLSRLADVWDRRKLIAVGLAAWSLLTALSGMARSFPELAAARFGVGVGEASAAPAAFSLLSDSFPPQRRATVLAVYSSGIYIGAGLGIAIGGWIVQGWDAAFGAAPPLGLRGWQVAFFAAGLPGLLLAAWVATLREPRRGAADGIFSRREEQPFRQFFLELRSVLPPLTLLHLVLVGAGRRAVARNSVAAFILALLAALLTAVTRTPAQWIALAIGIYSAFSWAQSLGCRDPVAFQLIFRTPAVRHSALAFSFLAFLGYGIGFWLPPFFVRCHHVDERQAGIMLGAIAAAGGWLGIPLGGLLADRWRRRSPVAGFTSACSPQLCRFRSYSPCSRRRARSWPTRSRSRPRFARRCGLVPGPRRCKTSCFRACAALPRRPTSSWLRFSAWRSAPTRSAFSASCSATYARPCSLPFRPTASPSSSQSSPRAT